MSAIVGIFNRDHAPVQPPILASMMEASRRWRVESFYRSPLQMTTPRACRCIRYVTTALGECTGMRGMSCSYP
jgi:hypothetical protein